MPALNELVSSPYLRMPQLRSREVDINADGLNDEETVEVIVPLNSGETVHRVTLISAFEYQLTKQVHLNMEGLYSGCVVLWIAAFVAVIMCCEML